MDAQATAQVCDTASQMPPKITLDNVEEVFTYHSPDRQQLDDQNAVRDASLRLARQILTGGVARTSLDESYQHIADGLAAVENLRKRIVDVAPDCFDRAQALDQLERVASGIGFSHHTDEVLNNLRLCRMWANAAIALKGLV